MLGIYNRMEFMLAAKLIQLYLLVFALNECRCLISLHYPWVKDNSQRLSQLVVLFSLNAMIGSGGIVQNVILLFYFPRVEDSPQKSIWCGVNQWHMRCYRGDYP